ncbi:uncharacterized protein Z520_00588 [Fonsecaea multimorphosa CBS 102226]|uniref:Zn(2)-C6 fungal-type domain-containing protein n=1 Tax=Fonsecaea multimorphosa CBS 102226 TaxID=1442371 RepID=A0A0D2HPW4_9EURO|nr:uncharacterized protein Z520_00588 [Fonsecaea multimorphosa CBS 102226]KIY03896.1 hypothetical protein Z520_00588 [Fonsecaea multimorphosa CBS 102226]OAL32157.1 hypothetical protein AYO22_00607 [Fonsecaea multimorphosa]
MTPDSSTKSTPSSQTLQNSPRSMTEPEAPQQPKSDNVQSAKQKRVRTGCLTCRERHLKCDEALPNCQNCIRSNRKCKRGVRLNFIDVHCQNPPYLVPRTRDWSVSFQDDSRDIASEYQGGREKYHPLEPEPKRQKVDVSGGAYDYSQIAAPTMSHPQLPAPHSYPHSYAESAQAMYSTPTTQAFDDTTSAIGPYPEAARAVRQPYHQQTMVTPVEQEQIYPRLEDRNEVLYMQVYVEEVGLWMDSMDAEKHFSRLIPFQALKEPMLKYALLACGVRHLTLVNPIYPEEHALNYYNNATQLLLKALQDPDRDSVLCATTATILNVYEVMSEKALQRMNHIAGARALIKECRWDATSTGIGAACFWLNVGLELFSCLHFNWAVAWDPDTWGIDIAMTPQLVPGHEEDWAHRMLWILSKITNFRSEAQRRYHDSNVHAEQMRLHQRNKQWLGLKFFCDRWHECVPPTMHALASVPPQLTSSKSAFPELWYLKRTTIVARLFYHTAMALLGSVHPLATMHSQKAEEMQEMRIRHSRQVCGIVAHVKDRGVASASIRCLAVAGENLSVRREQEEVLQIFDRIKKETGWRVDSIHDELREKWGWTSVAQDYDTMSSASSFYAPSRPSAASDTPNATPPRAKYPSGIVNPLYQNADFSAQNPPYQGNYVPPASGHVMHNTTQMYGYSGITAI